MSWNITLRYNIGDKIRFFYEGLPYQGTIQDIDVSITSSRAEIRYRVLEELFSKNFTVVNVYRK